MNHNKLRQIMLSLNSMFYDRQREVEALMIALLSRQHVLLIGPAGTGKSALASMLSKFVEDSHYFQHLLTRFSTPDELFGPLSLKELEQGNFKRNIEGMLPEAQFAFIDEIFKANSSVLNSLLSLINERIFYDNGKPINCPLMTLIGSSNEYIEEGEGLEALFDRFLLRLEVTYIREEDLFISMLKDHGEPLIPSLSLHELHHHQQQVNLVEIPDAIYHTIAKIRTSLLDEGIHPSDRRFKQSLSLLRANAYLAGRMEVERNDLLVLTNVLWNRPEERETTAKIIFEIVDDSVDTFIERISPEFDTLLQIIEHSMTDDAGKGKEMVGELLLQGKSLYLEVQELTTKMPNRKELVNLKNDMHKRLLDMTSQVIGF
ncbi:MoxR-like ATPase [Ureibacillus xyleni]|uniref:MoxR-like ATPase n=1 Tax=Ureibacillus xyleni TaxID=614648 RepID=A0A285SG03_9BACL|nr:AAA family ATPase [Ureibacillus xyleni]SOC06300.1 MoxR-like ATPase [Ureibacillus xyleni]